MVIVCIGLRVHSICVLKVDALGVDSLYHVQSNVNVRRGISVYNMHKGIVLFFLVCRFKKLIRVYDVKVDVPKRVLRFR